MDFKLRDIKIRIVHFWNNPNIRTRKINRNVIYSFVLKGASILISLMLVPLTLGYLNNYEYGVWITLNSVLTWINVLDIGLGNGLRNKLAESIALGDMTKGKIYVSTTFALLTLISISLCVICLTANLFIDWNKFLNIAYPINNLNQIVNIVLICISINFTIRTIGQIYLSFQESAQNSLLTVLGSLLSMIWIYLLTKFTEPSLMKVAVAFSLSPIIVYVLAYPYTFLYKYKEIKPSVKHIRKKYVKTLGGLGLKFFLLQVACLILFFTSNILVSQIFSPAEVTPYSICYRYYNFITSVFLIIINPIWSGITDAYIKHDVKWLVTTMHKIQLIFLYCILATGLMLIISPYIYRLWVGSSVQISWGLNISLAVFNIIMIWANLYSTWCNGVGHLNLALYSMGAAAVLYIPLCIWTTRFYGLPGVATALSMSLIIPSVFMYLQYHIDIKNLRKAKC